MIPTGNAKFALVVAEGIASYDPDKQTQLDNFLSNIGRHEYTKMQRAEGMKTLHNNVWLIPLSNGLPWLGSLIEWGRTTHIRLNILFLDSPPEWIQYPPDDKTP